MVLMTYQLPEAIREVALEGEFDEFDLNSFFSAKGEERDAEFVYESEVQKWLDLIRGQYLATTTDNLKLGAKTSVPFSDSRLIKLKTVLVPTYCCFVSRNGELVKSKSECLFS